MKNVNKKREELLGGSHRVTISVPNAGAGKLYADQQDEARRLALKKAALVKKETLKQTATIEALAQAWGANLKYAKSARTPTDKEGAYLLGDITNHGC